LPLLQTFWTIFPIFPFNARKNTFTIYGYGV
jgi:hypothetical protein